MRSGAYAQPADLAGRSHLRRAEVADPDPVWAGSDQPRRHLDRGPRASRAGAGQAYGLAAEPGPVGVADEDPHPSTRPYACPHRGWDWFIGELVMPKPARLMPVATWALATITLSSRTVSYLAITMRETGRVEK